MKNKLIILLLILPFPISLAFAEAADRSKEISAVIDQFVGVIGKKANMQNWIPKVTAYGNEAVPHLTLKYQQTTDHQQQYLDYQQRYWLMWCLCSIGSEEARLFVRQTLKERSNEIAISCAIQHYPIPHEDEITPILIDILTDGKHSAGGMDSSERLRAMILRKPSLAGALIESLKDVSDAESHTWEMEQVLAAVSGYSNCITGGATVAERNKFWRDWWKRNKNKDVFEWMVDAWSTGKEEPKLNALHAMIAMDNKRAIPYLLMGLDSPSNRIQNQAYFGLLKLKGLVPDSGSPSQALMDEKAKMIPKLKAEFAASQNTRGTKRD